MKRIALSASALALLSGIALAAPAQASSLTAHERAALARSHAHLRVLERNARADGHVSLWEKAKISLAKSRLHTFAWRLRHN
jgi:hypothetical protein